MEMSRSNKMLLALGFAIALFQVSSIGVMIFDVAPMAAAVALKVALFVSVGAFVAVSVRAVRGGR